MRIQIRLETKFQCTLTVLIFFWPNLPKNGISSRSGKIALVRASMVVTYYIKLFRRGVEKHRILMSLLLLVVEATSWGWARTFDLQLNMTCCASLVVSELKFIFHWWARVLMSSKSLLIWFALAYGSVTVENNDLSSANNFGFEVRLSARSLI